MPWRWRQRAPVKRQHICTNERCVTSQKTGICITISVRTSRPSRLWRGLSSTQCCELTSDISKAECLSFIQEAAGSSPSGRLKTCTVVSFLFTELLSHNYCDVLPVFFPFSFGCSCFFHFSPSLLVFYPFFRHHLFLRPFFLMTCSLVLPLHLHLYFTLHSFSPLLFFLFLTLSYFASDNITLYLYVPCFHLSVTVTCGRQYASKSTQAYLFVWHPPCLELFLFFVRIVSVPKSKHSITV